ncbi:hypothetical protein P9869_35625 [Streptomyces ossamyceticus]|nr:hypothetical protein [Streptomyces ossamyceticus]
MHHIVEDDDPTTPDRAARARMAWELYRGAYSGSEIGDLITDLMHLADVDEHLGGGAHAGHQGVNAYLDEQPTWEKPAVYLVQFRPKGGEWITIVKGDDSVELREVADHLWTVLQRHGFRTGEIASHIDDIVRGDILTAECGAEFRAFKNPHYQG